VNNAVLSSPGADAGPIDEADLCAVLVLDASGNVVAANRSARHLWAGADRAFVRSAFAELFVSKLDSNDPEFLETESKVLIAGALDRWTPLVAKPLDGQPRAVRVRLERALGGAGSYIATIQPQTPAR
jgi:hypothetical protein